MRRRILVMAIVVSLYLLLVSLLKMSSVEAMMATSVTFYIRANGSIDPQPAPISTTDNVTYTLSTSWFYEGNRSAIVVERDNIVVDGAGYTVQGTEAYPSKGMYLWHRSNVTVRNTTIRNFWWGITLNSTSKATLCGNNIANNKGSGIMLDKSSNNSISKNTIANNSYDGIYLGTAISFAEPPFSDYNNITENTITNNGCGIYLYSSSNNTIAGNDIANNRDDGIGQHRSKHNSIRENNITNNQRNGVYLDYSEDNSIVGNNIINNNYGIWLWHSSNYNSIVDNNFINNTNQVQTSSSVNFWDNGTEGNYWSDYKQRYPNAAEIDGSGIWNTPYVIDSDNIDHYPIVPELPSALVLPLFMTATLLVSIVYRRKHAI